MLLMGKKKTSSGKAPSRKGATFHVQIPQPLWDAFEELRKSNSRTKTAEAILALKAWLQQHNAMPSNGDPP